MMWLRSTASVPDKTAFQSQAIYMVSLVTAFYFHHLPNLSLGALAFPAPNPFPTSAWVHTFPGLNPFPT